MSTLRSDIRTRVRDYLYEDAADWFSDSQLNTFIVEEINSLPSKDIYLEQIYTTNLVNNQQDYSLPTGTKKVEKFQVNNGTTAVPSWEDLSGWDLFNNAIYLDWSPSTTDAVRAFLQVAFTVPTGDVVALDVPDDVCEIVVWGVVVRCYKRVIGYLRQSKNWDSITKSDAININSVTGWLREAKSDYNDLIKQYMTVSRPRDINMVS